MLMIKENTSFELDAERVKKQNASPGAFDLIMHVTIELPIGLRSHNLTMIFKLVQTLRIKQTNGTCFCFLCPIPTKIILNKFRSKFHEREKTNGKHSQMDWAL